MTAESDAVARALVPLPAATSSRSRGAAQLTPDHPSAPGPHLERNEQPHHKETESAIRVRDRPLRCSRDFLKGYSSGIGRRENLPARARLRGELPRWRVLGCSALSKRRGPIEHQSHLDLIQWPARLLRWLPRHGLARSSLTHETLARWG